MQTLLEDIFHTIRPIRRQPFVSPEVSAPGGKEVSMIVVHFLSDFAFNSPNPYDSAIKKVLRTIEVCNDIYQDPYSQTMSRSGEFLPRLWCIINEPRLASIISWSADSTTVCLLDKDAFEKFVLPYVYKAKKLSSFYRQLRIYGFKRTTSVKDDAVNFKHREFTRNTSINVLYNIERYEYSERNKPKSNTTATPTTIPSETSMSNAPPHLPYMTAPSTTTFISKVSIGGYAASHQTPPAETAQITPHAPVPVSPTEQSPILNEDFEANEDFTIYREL